MIGILLNLFCNIDIGQPHIHMSFKLCERIFSEQGNIWTAPIRVIFKFTGPYPGIIIERGVLALTN